MEDSSNNSSEEQESHEEMSFLEHLDELRKRLVYSCVAILCGAIICLCFSKTIFNFLSTPLYSEAGAHQEAEVSAEAKTERQGVKLIGTGPAEAFLVKLKVSFAAGIFLVLPVLFFQLWAFIAPGLHQHERKLAIPFVISSTVFFLIGAGFCYYGVLPFAFEFFLKEYASIGIAAEIRIAEYLSFIIRLLLVFGILFNLPVVTYLLARLSVIRSTQLKLYARYIVVSVFIAAALLTPPDVVTQLLLAFPLLLLFALCYGITLLVERQRAAIEIDKNS